MMDDGAFDENLPEELRELGDALRASRDVPDGHQLDRVQRRIIASRARRWTLLGGRLPSFAAVVLLLATVLTVGLAHLSVGQVVSSFANAVTSGTNEPPAAVQVYCQAGPSTASIQSNFNSTPIAAGNVIWFSAVFKISGTISSGATISYMNQTISGIPGVPGSVTPPNSQITFVAGATPSATYNQATNTWMITLPTSFSGNGLLAAVPVIDTNGAPRGGNGTGPTWSGSITSSTPAVSINWQWAAAVYPASSGFPTTPAGYNLIGASPLDGFVGSDHAGTPENFKTHVIGGATGGGASNYTGSLSGTQTLTCIT